MASTEVDLVETEATLDDEAELQEAREAAEDLERIETEVKREAEQYVEAVDGDGNEQASVEAAATAFDFDQAEHETEMIAGEAKANIEG